MTFLRKRLNDESIDTGQSVLRVYMSRTPVALPRRDYLRHRVDSRTWVIEVPRGLTRLTFSSFPPAQEIGIEIDVALQMCVSRLVEPMIDCRLSFLLIDSSVL